LFVYSLGFGPPLISLILMYSFAIFPGKSSGSYVTIVLSFFCFLAFWGRKAFPVMIRNTVRYCNDWLPKLKNRRYRYEWLAIFLIVSLSLCAYLYIFITVVLSEPLYGQDITSYGTLGKYVFGEKSLTPFYDRVFQSKGFVFTRTHKPFIVLLAVWERIINDIFEISGDVYFKSLGAYYGILLWLVLFYLVAKKDKWMAVIASAALVSGFSFGEALISAHIDTFRIYMLALAVLFFAFSLKNDADLLSLSLFGIYGGFAASSHTIGLGFIVFAILIFPFFLSSEYSARFKKFLHVVVLIFSTGSFFFVLNLIYGSDKTLLRIIKTIQHGI